MRTSAPPATVSLLTPGDTATISAIYGNLSPRSRSMRFLTAVPTMPPSLLRRLAACDGYDHVVMVARVAGHPVGEGRYIHTGDGVAEVSGAVVDTWTQRGIAGHLLTLLSRHARHRGLDRFVFTVCTENRAVFAALRRRGAVMATSHGAIEGHLDLHNTVELRRASVEVCHPDRDPTRAVPISRVRTRSTDVEVDRGERDNVVILTQSRPQTGIRPQALPSHAAHRHFLPTLHAQHRSSADPVAASFCPPVTTSWPGCAGSHHLN